MNTIKKNIVRVCPLALTFKAWLVAISHKFNKTKKTYSQSHEDSIVEEILYKSEASSIFYVDVGANHPTRLSNTYRLYRKGASGLVIEPNIKLLAMHRFVRSRDIQLGIGCGEKVQLLPFRHEISHVLSGFDSKKRKSKEVRISEIIPVMPLDIIITDLKIKEIAVMSVDVEGFDLEVLRGAECSLKITKILIVEGSEKDTEITNYMSKCNFTLKKITKHNIIFTNNLYL